MKSTIAVLILAAASPLWAAETSILIGETRLEIPPPAGFVRVTKEMGQLDEVLETFVAPQNVRFASFIPTEYLAQVQQGTVPAISRTLSIQTTKPTVDRTITHSDFDDLKKVIREQNGELIKKIAKEVPDAMAKINRKLAGQLEADPGISLSGIIPMSPHEETDRTMGYSMFVNYKSAGADGTTTNFSGVVTATFIHAKAKLFFIYVNGSAADLDWSRQVSKAWSAAILAANPSDSATTALESASARGFRWGNVGRSALIGGAIGGLFGLVRYFFKKKSDS